MINYNEIDWQSLSLEAAKYALEIVAQRWNVNPQELLQGRHKKLSYTCRQARQQAAVLAFGFYGLDMMQTARLFNFSRNMSRFLYNYHMVRMCDVLYADKFYQILDDLALDRDFKPSKPMSARTRQIMELA